MSFLKHRRNQLNLSQTDLATALSVSQQTIARWETKGEIPAKYLKDLAVITDSTVNELLGVEDTERPGRGAVSPLMRYTAKQMTEDEESRLPFGDVQLCFSAAAGGGSMYFPITHGEKDHIENFLDVMGESSWKAGPWFQFEALNNRWVAVNVDWVERVSFVDDAVEEMSSYLPVELYKAITELNDYEPERLKEMAQQEDAPYSKKLIEVVQGYLEEKSGDEREQEFHSITCHLAGKGPWTCDATQQTTSALELMFGPHSPNRSASSLLQFNLPDSGTTEYLRLGAVKLIEAPLVLMGQDSAS